jgi:hypothetical protein
MFKQCLFAIVTITLLGLTTGCIKRQSGTYLIYKVDNANNQFPGQFGEDDSLNHALVSQLTGSKLDIKFEEKFIKLKLLNLNHEVLLPKLIDSTQNDVYYTKITRDLTSIEMTIRYDKQGEMIYIYDVSTPKENFTSSNSNCVICPNPNRVGKAICYLNKLSNDNNQ